MTALCTQLHNTVSRPPLHLLSLSTSSTSSASSPEAQRARARASARVWAQGRGRAPPACPPSPRRRRRGARARPCSWRGGPRPVCTGEERGRERVSDRTVPSGSESERRGDGGSAKAYLVGEGLLERLLLLRLVDVLHQDALVLELVTLRLQVEHVVQMAVDLRRRASESRSVCVSDQDAAA